MATLVIKNLPDALHLKLKERARRNHRSLTKEAMVLIEAAVNEGPAPIDPTQAQAFAAVIAAGEELARQGVDVEAWAARSRGVWR